MTNAPEAIPADVRALARRLADENELSLFNEDLIVHAIIADRASRAPVDGAEAVAWPNRLVNYPCDDGSGDRIVGFRVPEDDPIMGKYGLSEPLAWLRSVTVDTHPAPASPDAELVEEVAILERLADRYAEVGQSAADGMANLLRDEARHLRKTGRVGRSEREALSKHGGDRS